jgi:hypothetical protein
MRVYIGPYKKWWGPYQLANLLQKVGVSEDRCDKIGGWLADTRIYDLCQWYDYRNKRKIKVVIHDYDTYNMDSTLCLIIAPMLRKLKEQKPGAPFVDDEDVPTELASSSAPPLTQDQKDVGETDANYFKRWEYVLDEMIWAFEQDEKLFLYDIDPEEIFNYDFSEGSEYDKYHKRRQNGFRLFGKYYSGLWT